MALVIPVIEEPGESELPLVVATRDRQGAFTGSPQVFRYA
jgi:hypothetical protein